MLIPLNVHALNGSVSISCNPSTTHPGDTVTCSVSANSDEMVTTISAQFTLGSGATITSFQPGASWNGNDINNNRINIYAATGETGNFSIGTINVKIDEAASAGTISVGIASAIFYDENDAENDVSGTSTNVEVTTDVAPTSSPTPTSTPSASKGLKTLTCTSGGTLSPQLSDTNTGYSIMLDKPSTSSFAINAVAKNSSDSVIVVNGDTGEQLNPSNITFKASDTNADMLIRINVGSGDNQVIYIITVSKPVSEKGRLSKLVVGGQTVALSNNKFEYQVELDSVDSYQILATVSDSNKFEVYSPNISRNLSGENSYEITVKPIDSTSGYESSIYVIYVGKKGGTPQPTVAPTVAPVAPSNPQTGEGGLIAMGLVLGLSFIMTIYLYKRNLGDITE